MKQLQMVNISDTTSLFIKGYDEESKELTFRTSKNFEYLQKEIVTIRSDIVYVSFYNFPIGFLEKFLVESRD